MGEAPVASHLMVVPDNAKPGQEDEFSRWYSQVHVLDTINKLDGFLSAQRSSEASLPESAAVPVPLPRDLRDRRGPARYRVRPVPLAASGRAEALAAGRDPVVDVSDTLDPSAFIVGFFSLTERIPSARADERTRA